MKKRILERAVENAAKRVQRTAKMLCPVNHGELRESINTAVESDSEKVSGIVYTNKEYAAYVEFGTGVKGEAEKSLFPPDVQSKLVYSQDGWYIPGDKISADDAQRYHLRAYKDSNGNVKYYYTEGQAPQPFLHPALESNKSQVRNDIVNSIKSQMENIMGGG